jgi:excisionase family DNA binding protein
MTRATAIAEATFLTPPECAQLLRVDPHTVANWISNGELRASNLARRGSTRPRWRIHRADLESFLAARAAIPRHEQAPKRRRPAEYHEWV